MPFAARLTDMHTCPMMNGPVPHVGGPIVGPGSPTVLIGNLPAACAGDLVTCVGPPDTILIGSPTVLLGNRQAARMGGLLRSCGVPVTMQLQPGTHDWAYAMTALRQAFAFLTDNWRQAAADG